MSGKWCGWRLCDVEDENDRLMYEVGATWGWMYWWGVRWMMNNVPQGIGWWCVLGLLTKSCHVGIWGNVEVLWVDELDEVEDYVVWGVVWWLWATTHKLQGYSLSSDDLKLVKGAISSKTLWSFLHHDCVRHPLSSSLNGLMFLKWRQLSRWYQGLSPSYDHKGTHTLKVNEDPLSQMQ